MRRAVSVVDFAHDEGSVLPGGVREDSYRDQNTVRAASGGLLGRAAVKSPFGKFFEFREGGVVFDLCLATEVADGFVAVEPDVFEFVFGHGGYL